MCWGEIFGVVSSMPYFLERNLVSILGDLYLAGSDTTSTTLSWMILYLCKMPDVQKKFQAEIESVTRNKRPSTVSDRPE